MRYGAVLTAGTLLFAAAVLWGHGWRSEPVTLVIEAGMTRAPADGKTAIPLQVRTVEGERIPAADIEWEVVEGSRRVRLSPAPAGAESPAALLVAGVLPGRAVVEARQRGAQPARWEIQLDLDPSDTFADGTPDSVRLDSESDQEAFRRWFTFLAEAQYFRQGDSLPVEIGDCSGLARFAYREALREHSDGWAQEMGFEFRPPGVSIQKYHYPFTALGASLFRVATGPFVPEDLDGGAFAQFADARTLRGLNSHFVSRDLSFARPGDLLFFKQLTQDMPFHMMIYAGESHFEPGPDDWLVYHTGPIGDQAGEIRRVRVSDLKNHPSARWRPYPGNPNFLGVYRWNILRTAR